MSKHQTNHIFKKSKKIFERLLLINKLLIQKYKKNLNKFLCLKYLKNIY